MCQLVTRDEIGLLLILKNGFAVKVQPKSGMSCVHLDIFFRVGLVTRSLHNVCAITTTTKHSLDSR